MEKAEPPQEKTKATKEEDEETPKKKKEAKTKDGPTLCYEVPVSQTMDKSLSQKIILGDASG